MFFLLFYLFTFLKDFGDRVRRICFKDLLKVGGGGIILHAGVTEHGISWLHLGDGFYYIVGNIRVEASHEVSFGNVIDGLASYRCRFYLRIQGRTEFEHHLEEQVFARSVRLYIIHLREEVGLRNILWRIVDVLHIGGVKFQHTEACIEVLGG